MWVWRMDEKMYQICGVPYFQPSPLYKVPQPTLNSVGQLIPWWLISDPCEWVPPPYPICKYFSTVPMFPSSSFNHNAGCAAVFLLPITIFNWLPFSKLTKLLKMAHLQWIYKLTWWFSIAMLVSQRVSYLNLMLTSQHHYISIGSSYIQYK